MCFLIREHQHKFILLTHAPCINIAPRNQVRATCIATKFQIMLSPFIHLLKNTMSKMLFFDPDNMHPGNTSFNFGEKICPLKFSAILFFVKISWTPITSQFSPLFKKGKWYKNTSQNCLIHFVHARKHYKNRAWAVILRKIRADYSSKGLYRSNWKNEFAKENNTFLLKSISFNRHSKFRSMIWSDFSWRRSVEQHLIWVDFVTPMGGW